MSDLPDWRSALGHAVADAMQDELAKVKPRHRDGIDPRLLAAEVWPKLLLHPDVQRALVRWCRGVAEAPGAT